MQLAKMAEKVLNNKEMSQVKSSWWLDECKFWMWISKRAVSKRMRKAGWERRQEERMKLCRYDIPNKPYGMIEMRV